MKNRIAASLALAVGVALGASGCSLIAHNGTGVHYAPSDGVEANVKDVAFRNVLLVVDESGENLNVVFTAVNNTNAPAKVVLNFDAETAGQHSAVEFELEPGSTSFGDISRDQRTLVTTLKGVEAGQAVKTYFTVNGAGDEYAFVPVMDGTLHEYRPYVLSDAALAAGDVIDISKLTDAEIEKLAKAGGETVEEFLNRIQDAMDATK